jgi:hypothetical protein
MLARIHTIKQQDPSLVDRVWQEEHRLYKSQEAKNPQVRDRLELYRDVADKPSSTV